MLLFSASVPSKEVAAGGECHEVCSGMAVPPPLPSATVIHGLSCCCTLCL